MRKIILGLAVSLDGFIEDKHGAFDWCFTDQDYGLNDFYPTIDALLMGRKTYQVTQQMGAEADFPGKKDMKTYVFSDSLDVVDESSILVRSADALDSIQKLKSESGKDIWLYGGGELIRYLMQHRLVDILWLSVHPVLLGAGTPLFRDIEERQHLELLNTKSYDTGLVSLWYKMKV